MRLVASIFCAIAAGSTAYAEGYGPSLTVLLDFREAASDASVTEMQRELRQVLKPAGLNIQIRLRSDVPANQVFEDLVLFQFRGNCGGPAEPLVLDERGPGPLAFAHTADGRVQPFGEVACDSVRRAVDSALWGGQHANREQLFGRALGRVVAHELVHILANTNDHSKAGVFKSSLSGAQLIADRIDLDRGDFERLRRVRGSHSQ